MVFIWLRLVHSGLCLSNYGDEKKVPWSKDGKKNMCCHPSQNGNHCNGYMNPY